MSLPPALLAKLKARGIVKEGRSAGNNEEEVYAESYDDDNEQTRRQRKRGAFFTRAKFIDLMQVIALDARTRTIRIMCVLTSASPNGAKVCRRVA